MSRHTPLTPIVAELPGRGRRRPPATASRRLPAVLLAAALATAGLVVSAPPAAAEPECLHPSYDFDGDHTPDPVVGIPGGAGRAGAVQVRISNEDDQRTVQVKGPSGFGSAVGQMSSYQNEGDDQLCTQLVVGSPRETVDGKAGAGAVYVYAWDGKGFVQRGRYTPGHNGVPGSAQVGAHFGATVASATRLEDEVDPRSRRLYVGAPGQDVSGVKDAGSITSFRLGTGDQPQATGGKTINYASSGVPGAATTGGGLGADIVVGYGVVAIGAPGQTAGGVPSGAVLIIAENDAVPFAPQQLTQSTSGVPGSSERGDRFGAAVDLSGHDGDPGVTLTVGVPGEDLSSIADAGSVLDVPIGVGTGRPVSKIRAWNQDCAEMVGKPEAGDGFGSAVTSVLFGDNWVIYVGTPGEDINGHRDAGMAQALGEDWALTQSSPGIPGSNESGDRFGASLGGWAIGVPGENGGAGAVIYRGPFWDSGAVRWQAPSSNADQYGAAIAS